MRTFTNGNPHDTRPIVIKVDNEYILFYFQSELDRFAMRIKQEDYDDTEEEKEPNYFYWIGVDDWNNIDRDFVNHMKRKAWFTIDMIFYINEQIAKNETTNTIK